MKLRLIAAIVLALMMPSSGGDGDIPAENPGGSPRPSWWWSCWMGHVVVVQGEFSYNPKAQPDIVVTVSNEAAKKHFSKEDLEGQNAYSKFFIANLKPEKLLFVSPEIDYDGRISKIKAGTELPLKILVPVLTLDDGSNIPMAQGETKGVIVLRYGSIIGDLPFVFNELIPPEGIPSAKRVFEHRSKFNPYQPKDNKVQSGPRE